MKLKCLPQTFPQNAKSTLPNAIYSMSPSAAVVNGELLGIHPSPKKGNTIDIFLIV